MNIFDNQIKMEYMDFFWKEQIALIIPFKIYLLGIFLQGF